MTQHLFVYGTLLSDGGHPMHDVLSKNAHLVGGAYIVGRLYQVHHYPGAVVSDDPNERVYGEAYALDRPAETLAALDDYEGCGPGAAQPVEFARSLQRVYRRDGNSIEAWVYLYNRPIGNAPRILSGHFLEYAAIAP